VSQERTGKDSRAGADPDQDTFCTASVSSSRQTAAADKDGRLMAIFFGGRFNFVDALIFEGGGSDGEGLDDGGDFGAGEDCGRTSLSASLSLP
jgi:hypothetical protein